MNLGERLKQFRLARHLSQGDLQARTGLLRSYLSRVENGYIRPKLGTLEKWTSALGIPLYQLFYDGTSNEAPNAESDIFHDKNELQLRNFRAALAKMTPRDRQILFEVARQMAAKKSPKC